MQTAEYQTTEMVEVTPEMATRWLAENNLNNRNLRPGRVQWFARQIINGLFILTPQGISFDVDGVLMDGQHRLAAIVKTGCTVPLLVSRGWAPSTRLALDAGAQRSAQDSINMTFPDEVVTKNHVATARKMFAGFEKQTQMSVSEVHGFIRTHRNAIDFALEHIPGGTAGLSAAATRAAVARAYYHIEHRTLKRFCSVLCKPELLEREIDKTAILLWKWLCATGGRSGGAMVQQERYGKTERAIAAYAAGDVLAKLYATDKELFPLPENKDSK